MIAARAAGVLAALVLGVFYVVLAVAPGVTLGLALLLSSLVLAVLALILFAMSRPDERPHR